MAKKKRKVWVLNPGGVKGVEISDDDLARLAGIGLNKRNKRKRSKNSTKVGGNSMAKRKKRKKKTRRKKGVKRNYGTKKGARKAAKTRKKKKTARSRAAKKAAATRAKAKAKRSRAAKKAAATRKRKAKRTAKKSYKVAANRRRKPKRRRRSSKRRSSSSSRLPSLMMRRRSFRRNTPFLMRKNPGIADYLTMAPKKNPKKKRRTKRNKLRRFRTVASSYPRMNPARPGNALAANLRALVSVPVMVDAAQMTIGSVGAPVLAGTLSKLIKQVTGGKLAIDISKPAGLALQGVAGAVMATSVTVVMKNSSVGKNIMLGTIGGIFGDIAKKVIVPMLTPKTATAPATTSESTPEALPEPNGAGVSGVRADVAREVASLSGLNAYATGAGIIAAAADESF
jgi:hypothetical protein